MVHDYSTGTYEIKLKKIKVKMTKMTILHPEKECRHCISEEDKEARMGGGGIEYESSRESVDKRVTKARAFGAKAPKVSIEKGTNSEEQESRRGTYLDTL